MMPSISRISAVSRLLCQTAQVVSTTKTNHLKASETKDKICAAASAPTNEPHRGPGLGEALGMRSVPTPDSTSTGAGTLDSLSGNPLKR